MRRNMVTRVQNHLEGMSAVVKSIPHAVRKLTLIALYKLPRAIRHFLADIFMQSIIQHFVVDQLISLGITDGRVCAQYLEIFQR